jgi:flavodoxin
LTEEFPNYWGDMPMAVYTFLEKFDWNGKTIHPFCTHEGSGLSGTEGRLQGVCKGAVVTKGLAVQGSLSDNAGTVVEKWI